MVPTPRDDPAILDAWINYYCMARKALSLRQVCLELSVKYGCHSETVRTHLDPRLRERRRALNRRYYAHRKGKTVSASDRSVWRKQQYEKYYRRLTRKPERFLCQVFENQQEVDLEAITTAIRDLCVSIQFRPRTIERILREYETGQNEGRIRGPPWLRAMEGGWVYSDVPQS